MHFSWFMHLLVTFQPVLLDFTHQVAIRVNADSRSQHHEIRRSYAAIDLESEGEEKETQKARNERRQETRYVLSLVLRQNR